VGIRGYLRVEHNLEQTGSVSQVNEYEVAVVPPTVDPSSNGYFSSGVGI
jgi:hypothetical protein